MGTSQFSEEAVNSILTGLDDLEKDIALADYELRTARKTGTS